MREKNRIAQDKNRVVFVEVADSSFIVIVVFILELLILVLFERTKASFEEKIARHHGTWIKNWIELKLDFFLLNRVKGIKWEVQHWKVFKLKILFNFSFKTFSIWWLKSNLALWIFLSKVQSWTSRLIHFTYDGDE